MLDDASSQADLDALRSELSDKVAELEPLFLALEQAVRDGRQPIESVHMILRVAHSLKGSLAMAERPAASACVHAMETAFVALRERRLSTSRELFDLALATIDQLSHFADEGLENEPIFATLEASWLRLQEGAGEQPVQEHVGLPFPLVASEAEVLRMAARSGQHFYLVEKSILSELTRAEYDGLPIYEDVAELGTLVARRPSFEDIDRKQREAVLLLLIATSLDASALTAQIFDPVSPIQPSESDTRAYLAKQSRSAFAAGPTRIRSLVVEDDFTSRLLLQKFLSPLGESHVAVDGEEALAAVKAALESDEPYHLICLDIMMPKLDGQEALRGLRALEEAHGIDLGNGAKVIMTTCLKDSQHVMAAFREQCDAYIVKPVGRGKLLEQLHRLGLHTA